MKAASADKLLQENKFLKARLHELEHPSSWAKSALSVLSASKIYDALLHSSPNTIVVSKLKDGTICDVSDSFCRKSGFAREEVIGKTSAQLCLWTKQNREEMVNRLVKDGMYHNVEVDHQLRNGTIIKCLQSGSLVTIDGECCILIIVTNISVQKSVADALREERDLNNTIISDLPGLFCIVDENFKFIRWNNGFMSITGYSAGEMLGMTALDFHHQSDRSLLSAKIKQGLLHGEFSGEADIVSKDGIVRTVLLHLKRLQYEGKPCILGTGTDITEKKRTENELRSFAENLEDANIALRVLINRRNDEQKEIEEKLQANINDLVIPYLRKLKNLPLDDRHTNYLNVLESNLGHVLSPFMRDFLSAHQALTPQEIQIVDLIRKGKKTKEIADMLNASALTIMTHRNNIRKKLNLIDSKINLRSHIMSLK